MRSTVTGLGAVGLLTALMLFGACSDDGTVDSTPDFRVVEVSPTEDTRQVDLDQVIRVTFNQPPDTLTLDSNSVVLNDTLRGTVGVDQNVLTFTPKSLLDSGEVYEAKVSGGIADLAGHVLAHDYAWTFKTVDGAGYNWIESADTVSHLMNDVIWHGGRYVMVGSTDNYPGVGRVFTSVDGDHWDAETIPIDDWLYGIGYFKDRFLVVGLGGTVLSSRSGNDWEQVTTNSALPLFDIASSPTTCVAVSMGSVLVSDDGEGWTEVNVPFSGRLYSIGWVDDRFIATTAGDSMSCFLISETGREWDKITVERPGSGRTEFYGIAASDDLIVAVGPNENVLTSQDGINWVERDPGIPGSESVFLRSVMWDGQRFVAVGGSHLAWGGFTVISSDGVNWKQQNYVMDPGGEFTSIAWSGTRYVLSSSSMGGRIFYSP